MPRLAGDILRPCPLPAAGQRVLLVDLHPADRQAAGVQQEHAALPDQLRPLHQAAHGHRLLLLLPDAVPAGGQRPLLHRQDIHTNSGEECSLNILLEFLSDVWTEAEDEL